MKTLTFKVTDDEERGIRREAKRLGMTLSEYLRRRIRGDGDGTVRVMKSEATGAPAFSSGGKLPPLTTESVKEMLADFP
ncbi:MAG: hypothetical protein KDK99_10310 [Verrucomicrobiales bacterium]|nr:hypothetical protein [Verrucomicrobiales bacterium]